MHCQAKLRWRWCVSGDYLDAEMGGKPHGLTIALTVAVLIGAIQVHAQAYLGWTTKQVNLREGPGTDYAVLKSLTGGTQLFLVSIEPVDDFFEVIDIASNKEGYVHRSFVRVGTPVALNEEGVFTPAGRSGSQNPELEIYNNTRLTLTLKLNTEMYVFGSQERRTISVPPGAYEYRASAPGVIPDIGREHMDRQMAYSWEFYIVTR